MSNADTKFCCYFYFTFSCRIFLCYLFVCFNSFFDRNGCCHSRPSYRLAVCIFFRYSIFYIHCHIRLSAMNSIFHIHGTHGKFTIFLTTKCCRRCVTASTDCL